MKITEELLAAGASERGGFSRQQTELLGVTWPLAKGWKRSIIGKTISDDAAEEFVRLAGRHFADKSERKSEPLNWCGAENPTDIYIYVLALENGYFYVGLTGDVVSRTAKHAAGKGAEWTKLHPPVRRLDAVCTGTRDGREAEQMEDEITIALMERHGIDKVRGGHFCYLDQERVESQLRVSGFWERIMQAQMDRRAFDLSANWSEALDGFLETALRYYDAGGPNDQNGALFAACCKLTRYQYWHNDFAPGLSWQFWNRQGVLPVLLSFKLGRPVGSRLASAFDVLAAALTRGRGNGHPLRRIFLLAWQTYLPPVTDTQQPKVEEFMGYLEGDAEYDRQYDAFASVLFPQMRHLLRR